MVLGLGTRAVERVADDHPGWPPPSATSLRPRDDPAAIRTLLATVCRRDRSGRHALTTVPIRDLLGLDYRTCRGWPPWIRATPFCPSSRWGRSVSPDNLVLTFDNLLQRSEFIPLLKNVLVTLNHHYQVPVDVEFAVTFSNRSPERQLMFHFAMPTQSHDSAQGNAIGRMPEKPRPDQLFVATRMVPQGQVSGVDYIVHISPAAYGRMADPARRHEVGRIVGG